MGAMPVPMDPGTGKCTSEGFEFHYQGWEREEPIGPPYCSGATKENMFPEYRKGSLDALLLKKLDLSRE